MKHRIAVISDTHGLIRDEVREVLKTCEIIFHGGDINTQEIINELKEIATLYIVRGNNDKDWAENIPETINETVFGFSFFMCHKMSDIKKSGITENTDFVIYGVVNGRFCPQSVRNFCPIVAGFNAGTYKVPACVL